MIATNVENCVVARATFETPLGRILATWTRTGLWKCTFITQTTVGIAPQDSPTTGSAEPWSTSWIAELANAIQRFFASGQVHWDLQTLDWTGVTRFQRQVLEACCRIPSGTTKTYGQLAGAIGRPAAARAVGRVMARNRWPLLIPCHRVIGTRGALTGYSAAQGVTSKRWLLDFEAQQRPCFSQATLP